MSRLYLKEVVDMIKVLEPDVLRILDQELRLAKIKGAERTYEYAVGYIDGAKKAIDMISIDLAGNVRTDKFKEFMVELIAMVAIKIRWETKRDLETPVGYYPIAKAIIDIFREADQMKLLEEAISNALSGWW